MALSMLQKEGSELEAMLRDHINTHLLLPRKSFEIEVEVKANGGRPRLQPLTTRPEILHMAGDILKSLDVDTTREDDTTRWDKFWAAEYAAALAAISTTAGSYHNFLPGRHLSYELLSDTIENLLPDIRGRQIVEVGSGSGVSLARLAKRGAFATGLDTSRVALRFARYLSQHYGVTSGVELIRADYRRIPFSNDSFDVTYNSGVFEHLTEDETDIILSEMVRITKPAGFVLISVPNVESPFYRKLKKKADETDKKFKDQGYVELPWEKKRYKHDYRSMMERQSLAVVKEDGLQIAPSRPVERGDIRQQDLDFFVDYLPEENFKTIDGKIAVWKRLESNAPPELRRLYGWSVYTIGQKRAA